MKGNVKIRFNVIDIIISAFLALALFSMIYLFTQNQGIFTNTHYNLEYILEIDSIDQEIAVNLSSGDFILDSKTGVRIGQVSDIYHKINNDNTMHMILNINAKAENHNGFTTVNGVFIGDGHTISFRTPNLYATGKCVELIIK